MDSEPLPEESRPRKPSRLSAAFSVLRGEALVPAQIQAEWAEYQVTFNDVLTRFSALLARQAKADKKRVNEQLAAADAAPKVPDASSHKAELRRRAAGMGRGRSPAREMLAAPHQPPPPPESP